MNSLYSIEVVENKLDITKPHPFSLKVNISFKDENFKEYLLNNKSIRLTNIFAHGISPFSLKRGHPPYHFSNYIMELNTFLREGSLVLNFRREKNFKKANEIISEKIYKFLSSYEKEFNKLKLFAENYEKQKGDVN